MWSAFSNLGGWNFLKVSEKVLNCPWTRPLGQKKKLFFWTFYCDKQYFFRTLLSKIIALPCKLLANSFSVVLIGVCIVNTVLLHSAKCVVQNVQDRVASAAETWVQWRSDFQSGSRVLKKDVRNLFWYILGDTWWILMSRWSLGDKRDRRKRRGRRRNKETGETGWLVGRLMRDERKRDAHWMSSNNGGGDGCSDSFYFVDICWYQCCNVPLFPHIA